MDLFTYFQLFLILIIFDGTLYVLFISRIQSSSQWLMQLEEFRCENGVFLVIVYGSSIWESRDVHLH